MVGSAIFVIRIRAKMKTRVLSRSAGPSLLVNSRGSSSRMCMEVRQSQCVHFSRCTTGRVFVDGFPVLRGSDYQATRFDLGSHSQRSKESVLKIAESFPFYLAREPIIAFRSPCGLIASRPYPFAFNTGSIAQYLN